MKLVAALGRYVTVDKENGAEEYYRPVFLLRPPPPSTSSNTTPTRPPQPPLGLVSPFSPNRFLHCPAAAPPASAASRARGPDRVEEGVKRVPVRCAPCPGVQVRRRRRRRGDGWRPCPTAATTGASGGLRGTRIVRWRRRGVPGRDGAQGGVPGGGRPWYLQGGPQYGGGVSRFGGAGVKEEAGGGHGRPPPPQAHQRPPPFSVPKIIKMERTSIQVDTVCRTRWSSIRCRHHAAAECSQGAEIE